MQQIHTAGNLATMGIRISGMARITILIVLSMSDAATLSVPICFFVQTNTAYFQYRYLSSDRQTRYGQRTQLKQTPKLVSVCQTFPTHRALNSVQPPICKLGVSRHTKQCTSPISMGLQHYKHGQVV